MKTVYIAADGKQFEDQEECKIHEENLFQDRIFLFDNKGNRLPFTCIGLDEAKVLICTDREAALFLFYEFCHDFVLPWDTQFEVGSGMWQWENEGEYWNVL